MSIGEFKSIPCQPSKLLRLHWFIRSYTRFGLVKRLREGRQESAISGAEEEWEAGQLVEPRRVRPIRGTGHCERTLFMSRQIFPF